MQELVLLLTGVAGAASAVAYRRLPRGRAAGAAEGGRGRGGRQGPRRAATGGKGRRPGASGARSTRLSPSATY